MIKKIFAIALMVALVITTINYVPQSAKAAQSDAASYDYSDTSFIPSGVAEYTNKYKVAKINEANLQHLDIIQNPGFATKPGIYMAFNSADFGSVTVNGKAATYDTQGAGMLIHVANFEYKYNDLVVKTSSGAVAAEFYVYYVDGLDGEDSGSDPTETATTEAQTTEAETTVFEEGRELLPSFDQWDEKPAQATVTESSVSATIPAYTGGNNWASQLVKNGLEITNGRWYVASVTLVSSVARNFQLLVQNDSGHGAANWDVNNSENTFSVNAGEAYTFTTTFQATSASNPVLFGIMMGFVNEPSSQCDVEVTAASLKEYSSEAAASGIEPAELVAPASVAAYDFYAIGKGYQVVFKPGQKDDLTVKPGDDGAVKYNIMIDNSAVLTSFNADECSLVDKKKGTYSPWDSDANKVKYIDSSVFASYADDNVHTIYIQSEDADGNVSAKSKAGKVRISTAATAAQPATHPTDISRVYIVTNATKSLDEFDNRDKEESKQDASLVIISGDGTIKSADHYGTVKLRGNSTACADKKAYNISFNDKKEVIKGAPKGKKWCLLANAYEKTLIRNKMAMDFGQKLGNIATPMENYTDVYVNGVYKGTYVISEPAENGRAGVEYDDSDGHNDLLFELENNDRDETSVGAAYYRATRSNLRFVTEDLEDEVLELYDQGYTNQNAVAAALSNNAKFTAFKNTLNSFETALYNTESTDYTQYIDVDSFVDMYIINELFQTVDFGYSSVKFYITYNEAGEPTIHAGPLWDFDLSSGNTSNAVARSYNTLRCQNENEWFKQLFKHTDFVTKVKEKYQAMQGYIQNLYEDNTLGTNEIDANTAAIEASRIRNYTSAANNGAGWSETVADGAEYAHYPSYPYSYSTLSPYNTYTYSQHVEYLRTWIKNRNEFLVDTWDLTLDYNTGDEVVVSDDLAITGYQMSSNFGGESGQIGQRTVYQVEPKVEGQDTVEVGLVFGLNVNGDLDSDSLVVGSEDQYVRSYAATAAGLLPQKMGQSSTAKYYALTMVSSTDVSVSMYTSEFVVRAYAKLADGTYAYSTVKKYTVYKVADYLYSNGLISTLSMHNYIYDKVLKYVNSEYAPKDFDWSNTIVKPQ